MHDAVLRCHKADGRETRGVIGIIVANYPDGGNDSVNSTPVPLYRDEGDRLHANRIALTRS